MQVVYCAKVIPQVHSSGEMGPGDALLSSLPGWATQSLELAEILVWGSHQVPWSVCCSWAQQLRGTTAWELQKVFLESDMLSLWDHWPAAPDLTTWRLRLPQSLKWREPTLLACLSLPWMQGISMKSIRRTSTNPRLACASSEEWWNNPLYLGDLWRQLRQSYNSAVADTQLIVCLLQPCGWQSLGALASYQRHEPLRWESRVQDIGPAEASWLHIISNDESSPRDLHLNTKTQLHSTTSKLQCWTPYAKQLARQEHNPTH